MVVPVIVKDNKEKKVVFGPEPAIYRKPFNAIQCLDVFRLYRRRVRSERKE